MSADATHAYVGRGKCGHVTVLQVDLGDRETAKAVGQIVRGGGTVERVTLEVARTLAPEFCKCNRKGPKR